MVFGWYSKPDAWYLITNILVLTEEESHKRHPGQSGGDPPIILNFQEQ